MSKRNKTPSALSKVTQSSSVLALTKRLRKARERNKTLELQAHADVTLEVAICEQSDCEGQIFLHSHFEKTTPPDPESPDEHNTLREVLTCYCQSCTRNYNPTPAWLDVLAHHRKR